MFRQNELLLACASLGIGVAVHRYRKRIIERETVSQACLQLRNSGVFLQIDVFVLDAPQEEDNIFPIIGFLHTLLFHAREFVAHLLSVW